MFMKCPHCGLSHLVVIDAPPHNLCERCSADLVTGVLYPRQGWGK